MTELKRSTASAAAAAADVAPFVPMIPEEKRGRLSFDAFVVVVVVDYSPPCSSLTTSRRIPWFLKIKENLSVVVEFLFSISLL